MSLRLFQEKIKLLEEELLKFPLVACFNIKTNKQTNKQTLAQGLANITFLTNRTALKEPRGEEEGVLQWQAECPFPPSSPQMIWN